MHRTETVPSAAMEAGEGKRGAVASTAEVKEWRLGMSACGTEHWVHLRREGQDGVGGGGAPCGLTIVHHLALAQQQEVVKDVKHLHTSTHTIGVCGHGCVSGMLRGRTTATGVRGTALQPHHAQGRLHTPSCNQIWTVREKGINISVKSQSGLTGTCWGP